MKVDWDEMAKRGVYRQSHPCECGHMQMTHLCGCQVKGCNCQEFKPRKEDKK